MEIPQNDTGPGNPDHQITQGKLPAEQEERIERTGDKQDDPVRGKIIPVPVSSVNIGDRRTAIRLS